VSDEVLRHVMDLLAKPVPVEKFLLLAQTAPPYDDPTKAIAWSLGVGFSEALIGKFLRRLVPPAEIMPGCYLRGISPDTRFVHYAFLTNLQEPSRSLSSSAMAPVLPDQVF
jgi:hypothetical protein